MSAAHLHSQPNSYLVVPSLPTLPSSLSTTALPHVHLRQRQLLKVGGDLPDFLSRLRNVGGALMVAAAFGNFDNIG